MKEIAMREKGEETSRERESLVPMGAGTEFKYVERLRANLLVKYRLADELRDIGLSETTIGRILHMEGVKTSLPAKTMEAMNGGNIP